MAPTEIQYCSIPRLHRAILCVVAAMAALPMRSSGGEFDTFSMPNVLQLSDRILSGSEPQGDTHFQELARAGVKTIVSVDGIRPAAEAAARHQLRYVHIPVGYDGISPRAALSLTRVVRELPGRIYIHCHHGRHRGPAAAAIACMVEGSADHRRAEEILQKAGTGKDYVGLWRDVAAFTVPDETASLPALVEVADVQSVAAAMAQLSRSFERLTVSQAGSSSGTVEDSAADALLVREGLHETARYLSGEYDLQFRKWLTASDRQAQELFEALKARSTTAKQKYAALARSCQQCHRRYRD